MTSPELSRLCIHTITNKPWPIETAVEEYARAGIGGITVWRDALDGREPSVVRKRILDAGLAVVSLCRGGFFASANPAVRAEAVRENLSVIRQAHELGAPHVVLVCGADPKQPLEDSRVQILEGISAIAGEASRFGVRLAIEPLHPMYADSRSAISTLEQANDICDLLDLPEVGVAIDVYHLFWDPHLPEQIERCGAAQRILAFHVSDWLTPTRDLLNDRGIMGDGCIPIRTIREQVVRAGFDGQIEVEIFSNSLWASDQRRYLDRIIDAYRRHV